MITAEQAKKQTDDSIEEQYEMLLEQIEQKIMQATANGSYTTITYVKPKDFDRVILDLTKYHFSVQKGKEDTNIHSIEIIISW